MKKAELVATIAGSIAGGLAQKPGGLLGQPTRDVEWVVLVAVSIVEEAERWCLGEVKSSGSASDRGEEESAS